jgi:hypothetical protein
MYRDRYRREEINYGLGEYCILGAILLHPWDEDHGSLLTRREKSPFASYAVTTE